MEGSEIKTPVKTIEADPTLPHVSADCNAEEISAPNSHLKVHPHGLSSKKKIATFQLRTPTDDNSSDPKDGNKLQFENNSNDNEVENIQNNRNDESILENMDVNTIMKRKRSHNNEDKTVTLTSNYSDENINISDDMKENHPLTLSNKESLPTERNANQEQSNKRPRVDGLQAAPEVDTVRSSQLNDDDQNVQIEMLENNSSPLKNEGDMSNINKNDTADILNSIKNEIDNFDSTYSSPSTPAKKDDDGKNIAMDTIFNTTESIHKLSPIFPKSQRSHDTVNSEYNTDIDKAHSVSLEILRRNEELANEVHKTNTDLNDCLMKLENLSYEFQKHKEQSLIDQERLTEKTEELEDSLEKLTVLREELSTNVANLEKQLHEKQDEIKMLNQNQSILQHNFDKKLEDEQKAREEYIIIQNEKDKAIEDLRNCKGKVEELESEIITLKTQINENEDWNSKLLQDKTNLEAHVKNIEEKDLLKSEQITELEKKLQDAISSQKNTNTELSLKVEELLKTNSSLEKDAITWKYKLESREIELKTTLEGKEKELANATSTLSKYESQIRELRSELTDVEMKYSTLKKSFEDVDDDAKIRSAEVTELNYKIDDLREKVENLESSLQEKDDYINKLKEELQSKKDEHSKTLLELESVHLKNNNIEKEHLAELEGLHESLSHLEEKLKSKTICVNDMKDEIAKLEDEKKEYLSSVSKQNITSINTEGIMNLQNLQREIDQLRDKLNNSEQEKNKQLQQLSDDLYVQYSSKHEQKVKMLKKNYEATYKKNLEELKMQNKSYIQEIKQLTSQLDYERKEKQELLKLLEQK